MERRDFIKASVFGPTVLAGLAAAPPRAHAEEPAIADREHWRGLLARIATPVLQNMSKGQLQKNMTVELSPIWDGRDRRVTYMECFARLMSGLAPWLTLPQDGTAEAAESKKLTEWALKSFAHSVHPKSPDYLLWRKEGQPLVDSAYFSNALMRAPKQLWEPLDKMTKARIVTELKLLRRVSVPYQNWILFAAMNEAFLLSVGEQYDPVRISLAIHKINEWYVGDGWYADGPRFHFDYYNSYVIHTMLVEILEVMLRSGEKLNGLSFQELYDHGLERMQRYGEHLERIISPEGTFPAVGRSSTYRTAVFQPLAWLAWRKKLPARLTEGRVRAAMTAVHRRLFANPTNFTPDGYLTIGFSAHQPEMADIYSNNGSMYITSESLLPLGLAASDSFWTAPSEDWTMKRAYAGKPFERDHALDD